MHKLFCCAFAVLLSGISLAWGDDEGLGDKLYTSDLVRMADVAPNGNAAGDPLVRGHVDVHRKRVVVATLHGAAPDATYQLQFCWTIPQPAGCDALGTLTTNAAGDGWARFDFQKTGLAFTGFFVLLRGTGDTQAPQFVTGFKFSPEDSVPGGTEAKLEGKIASLGANVFRLENLNVDIAVDANTKYDGVEKFEGLVVGQTVVVKGFTKPDGSILATKIEVVMPDAAEEPGNNKDKDKEKKDHEGQGRGKPFDDPA